MGSATPDRTPSSHTTTLPSPEPARCAELSGTFAPQTPLSAPPTRLRGARAATPASRRAAHAAGGADGRLGERR